METKAYNISRIAYKNDKYDEGFQVIGFSQMTYQHSFSLANQVAVTREIAFSADSTPHVICHTSRVTANECRAQSINFTRSKFSNFI